jgi:hypothetical protein
VYTPRLACIGQALDSDALQLLATEDAEAVARAERRLGRYPQPYPYTSPSPSPSPSPNSSPSPSPSPSPRPRPRPSRKPSLSPKPYQALGLYPYVAAAAQAPAAVGWDELRRGFVRVLLRRVGVACEP